MDKMDLRSAISEVLRVERARRRISNPDLVARSGVSTSALSRLLAGERDMSMPQLFALTAVLGITPAGFVDQVTEVLEKGTAVDW